ncbi:hypothetical protein CROQUDRAFT_714262 [Cronartium quercuum f. sp. fusiforme G11]|uniref:Uncharacterized protein n=1 Tax=Cronartium quercuum f. sp. fusiforme G11 TaxID=708437 RepID=A0A9P6NNQ3_9BASI|nr:hypothetical protein CROQUDRAFT_714262 [Cronartium quercuum f. sp. fusiforme G11]
MVHKCGYFPFFFIPLTILFSAQGTIRQTSAYVSVPKTSIDTELIRKSIIITDTSGLFTKSLNEAEHVTSVSKPNFIVDQTKSRNLEHHVLCKRHGDCAAETYAHAIEEAKNKLKASGELLRGWDFKGENFDFYKIQLSRPGIDSLIDETNLEAWKDNAHFAPTPEVITQLIDWFSTKEHGDVLIERLENMVFSLKRAKAEQERLEKHTSTESLIWWSLAEMKEALHTMGQDHSFPTHVLIREVLGDPSLLKEYTLDQKNEKIEKLVNILNQPTQIRRLYSPKKKVGEGSAGRWGLSSGSRKYIDSLKFGNPENPLTKQYTRLMEKLLEDVDKVVKKLTGGEKLSKAEESQLELLALSNGLSGDHVLELGQLLADLRPEAIEKMSGEQLQYLKDRFSKLSEIPGVQGPMELKALFKIFQDRIGEGEVGLRILEGEKLRQRNMMVRALYHVQTGYIKIIKGFLEWFERLGKWISSSLIKAKPA